MSDIYNPSTIKIRTLGEFSLEDDERKYIVDLKKQGQLVTLLQYIIIHRNRVISSEELIDLIWGGEKIDNPGNALKNLVYRLRNLLSERMSVSKIDYISHRRGGYIWNDTIKTLVDVEEFEYFYALANNEKQSIDNRIKFLTKTVECYKGDFMPDSDMIPEVKKLRKRYQNYYLECIYKKAEFLMEVKNYQELAEYTLDILRVFPDDKKILFTYLNSLYLSERYEELIEEYKRLSRYLRYDGKLMPKPCEELYYRTINFSKENLKNTNKNADQMISILSEEDSDSAYYCDYEIFKNYYRLQIRNAARSGLKVLLMVISANILNHNSVKCCSDMMNVIRMCCINTLRKGDAVTQFGENQIMILASGVQMSDGEIISERISENVSKYYGSTDIELEITMQYVKDNLLYK